jgi:hypothetical protein
MTSQRIKPQPNPLRETQAELIERLKAESDLIGPLGAYPAPRPESGPSCEAYYKEKFRRGLIGTYWLHHCRGGWFV